MRRMQHDVSAMHAEQLQHRNGCGGKVAQRFRMLKSLAATISTNLENPKFGRLR